MGPSLVLGRLLICYISFGNCGEEVWVLESLTVPSSDLRTSFLVNTLLKESLLQSKHPRLFLLCGRVV